MIIEHANGITNKRLTFKKLLLILALIILIYHSTLYWLYQRYTASDTYYSYGYFVPLISLYLIWLKKKELTIDHKFNFLGLTIIILALTIHSFSILAGVFFLSGFSLLLLMIGIALFLLGRSTIKKIIFPLTFLVFMFPLPLVMLNSISYFLRIFLTKSTVFVLKTVMHLSISNERFQIVFPRGILTIDDSCSGLHSLIVILTFTSVFAYLLKANRTKKIALFLLAAPIAIISNFIRILLLSFGSYLFGSNTIKGFFHELTGYLTFAIAITALWLFWKTFQCKNPI
ncbi:MAG: exosortase/archaeosortase family protein [Actinomycetota bacterium]